MKHLKHKCLLTLILLLGLLIIITDALSIPQHQEKTQKLTLLVSDNTQSEMSLRMMLRHKRSADHLLPETLSRSRRQIELMDLEDSKNRTGIGMEPPEDDGFWSRIARVALNLLQRFLKWLNE